MNTGYPTADAYEAACAALAHHRGRADTAEAALVESERIRAVLVKECTVEWHNGWREAIGYVEGFTASAADTERAVLWRLSQSMREWFKGIQAAAVEKR